MGREQLMAQQRARVLAMRARKLAEKKAAEAAKKYGSGKTKGVTRDTSNDQSRKELKKQAEIKRYGSGGGNATTRTRTGGKSRSATTTPVTSPKSAGTKPVQKQTRVQQAAKAVTQRSTPTNTRAKRQPGSTGGRGGVGGATPTKTKSNLNPQQRRKAGLTKKGGGMSLKDAIKKFDSKLRLTYKKGQLVQRGDEVFRSDGKGGLTRVYRKQF